MSGRIRVSRRDGLGWIVFDHPERHNAITSEMWQAIPGAARDLDADPDVRVVILRGAGSRAFVSGADISEFESARSGESAKRYDERNARAFSALTNLSKPLIAQIHGYCIGGGCALALSADLRFSDHSGVFAIPAARLGLGYAEAGLETLVSVVGMAAAKEIFFTARRFSAEEAAALGLVNRVLPDDELEEFVNETARAMAANAPLTLASAKLILRELARDSGQRDRAAIERSIRRCYESEDYAEGVRAFLQKRPARFSGR